jgi:UDP-N-acetyl-D-mannosaminuronate dehydrogenase
MSTASHPHKKLKIEMIEEIEAQENVMLKETEKTEKTEKTDESVEYVPMDIGTNYEPKFNFLNPSDESKPIIKSIPTLNFEQQILCTSSIYEGNTSEILDNYRLRSFNEHEGGY